MSTNPRFIYTHAFFAIDYPYSPRAHRGLPHNSGKECILVLQGGGALGAYQAGVFESLSNVYQEPTWVAGIAIGSINAALIAGNPGHSRIGKASRILGSRQFVTPATCARHEHQRP